MNARNDKNDLQQDVFFSLMSPIFFGWVCLRSCVLSHSDFMFYESGLIG